ncbi:hypothetical protein ACFYWU_28120 [Streptomyces chrestomyceticus]|uniref:hypothetical protein n=1 Tax=Streptomyces chrestomyceticus TaxID=68185 RepID=UPI0036CA3FFF
MRTWRLDLAVGRWAEALLPGMVRRVLRGAEPQPRWVPRRVLTVVSADVDTTAGVGAAWVVWRPKAAGAREHILIVERRRGRWRYVGGGSGPAAEADEVGVIGIGGGAGVRGLAHRPDPPYSVGAPSWIGCAEVHLGREVRHLLVGDRRIEVCGRRRIVIVWRSARAGLRPLLVALGHQGTELSRLGPGDVLDSRTWALLQDELREDG